MRMSLNQIRTDQHTSVELVLEGSAGMADAPLLRKTLKTLIQQGYTTLLVNLRRTRSLDRSCWDRLVSAGRELRRHGGRLILRHCPGEVYAELQARRWHDCFLVAEHSPGDAACVAANLEQDAAARLNREARKAPSSPSRRRRKGGNRS